VLYDFDVPNGHFYTQTNGKGGGGGRGFRVTDDSDAPLWTALKNAGGVQAVGYPISLRFRLDDGRNHVYQAFQKQVFDWDPRAQQLGLVNVMDLLHDAQLDGWLETEREVPPEADFGAADADRSWAEVMKAHLALLDGNKAIKSAYLSVPEPVEHFGLPTSGVFETEDALMLRTQRAVFQLWKQDTPWAKAGQVTLANAGELARDGELFSAQVFEPERLFPDELSGSLLPLPFGIPPFRPAPA
ncbi:MAG TPA: hypothetical protein VKU60_15060, partial [Chloroflexota bacterium]|nr:hypothetical protein [Chloroflexota bacterium]